MKTRPLTRAQGAPRRTILLAGSLGFLLYLSLDSGRTSTGVVSAGRPPALTTTFASSNSSDGHMFNVRPFKTIRIKDLSCNVDGTANTLVHYKVFSRVGSYEFKTQSASQWTLQAQGTTLSMGKNAATSLEADFDLVLPEGELTGFYVTLTSGVFLSTDTPTQHEIAASDANLAIQEGIGISYPFSQVLERQIWNGTIHYSIVAGTPFCFGGPHSQSCPCGNTTTGEAGCQNGSGRGALLETIGTQSVSAADLEFTVSDLPPNRPVLLLSGTSMLNGGQGAFYGDGLACIGGSLRAYGVHFSGPHGLAHWNKAVVAQAGYHVGETRYFQAVFRDVVGLGPCGSLFNLSNGYTIAFKP